MRPLSLKHKEKPTNYGVNSKVLTKKLNQIVWE